MRTQTSSLAFLGLSIIAVQAFADTGAGPAVASNAGPSAASSHGSRAMAASPRVDYRRPNSIPFPDENPFSESKARLGQVLFFDPRLSGSSWISCATCHNPGFAWGDGMARAIGHGMNTLARRTPTTLNLGWAPLLFWDGRADSLEAQALGPMSAPAEMNMPLADLEKKLNAIPGYKPLFRAAFGETSITATRVAQALATYERTLVSREAPFDRWVNGDESALSPAAVQGFALFNGKALCSKCHSGWRLTDDSFHDIGINAGDLGRGAVLKGLESMQYAFKTPTLRNVVQRAPFMHNGSEASLERVVEFYNRGGDVRRQSLSTDIRPLKLTSKEKQDLVEFLKSLSSVDGPTEVPALPL